MSGNYYIFGSKGFIGTSLINLSNYKYKNVDREQVDLSDIQSIKSYFSNITKVDVLIFLVGLVHKKGKNGSYSQHYDNNFMTLKNLLSAFSQINIGIDKIIFTSTVNVYDGSEKNAFYDEESPLNPKEHYAKTKKIAEDYLIKNYDNNYWIIRLAPVYSKEFQLNIERRTKIMNFFYKPGKGNTQFSMCNLNNLIISIDKIIDNKVPSGVYNISDIKEYDYNDLLSYKQGRVKIIIPTFLIKTLFSLSQFFNLKSLESRLSKLFMTRVYTSKKIRSFIDFTAELKDDR